MMKYAGKSDLIDMTVRVKATTERAALVEPVYTTRQPAWVPLSLVELAACDDRDGASGLHTLTIPEWLAIDKGLL
jgi:hypothetical protein